MPPTASPEPVALRRVPFGALRAFPELFQRYCTRYEDLAGFYAGDWRRAAARRQAAERAAQFPRDRGRLADVLRQQHERWGLDERTHAHIECLRDPEAVAVVTGQQLGLFAGPFYTLYKLITALQLTRQLARETGRPVVPVFWLEGEDHDLEEVASIQLLRRNEVVRVRYDGHAPPERGNLGAVGRLRFTEQLEDAVEQLEALLPPSDFKEPLMARLRDAYRPGTTWQDAFARLLRAFFPEAGLVCIDADDARLKRLVAPLYRRELEEPEVSSGLVREAGARLAQRFHAQVHPRPTNLFLLEDRRRHPIDLEGDRFVLRGRGRAFSSRELHALLEDHPERFSPNVVLRPLTQDLLLPTAAYVAGPSEVSYFAQYRAVYEWAGLPMPIVYPRASVTLVESKVQKVLDKFDLSVAAFDEDPARLFQRVVLDAMAVDVDALFKEAARHVHRAVNELKAGVEPVDRTLVSSAEATRAAVMKELDRLKDRVVRSEKRNQDEVRAQLEKAHGNLFPAGVPQERVLSPLYFLNKYGLSLLSTLERALSLDTSAHQVLDV